MGKSKVISIAMGEYHKMEMEAIAFVLKELDNNLMFEIMAGDGVELINQLGSATQTPDICIIGTNSGTAEWPDTIRKIKLLCKETKIIVLTGDPSNGPQKRIFLDCQVDVVLSKWDTTPEIIIREIYKLIEPGDYGHLATE